MEYYSAIKKNAFEVDKTGAYYTETHNLKYKPFLGLLIFYYFTLQHCICFAIH